MRFGVLVDGEPVTPDQLRDLQELAHQLDELTRHPGWQVFVNYAQFGDGMMSAQQARVLNGSCKSPEEYQRWTGWIAGSQAVLNIPATVAAIRDRESAKAGTETGE